MMDLQQLIGRYKMRGKYLRHLLSLYEQNTPKDLDWANSLREDIHKELDNAIVFGSCPACKKPSLGPDAPCSESCGRWLRGEPGT